MGQVMGELSGAVDFRQDYQKWVNVVSAPTDGQRRALTIDMLEDMELGYAVTVHKAQGSQWQRVPVSVTNSKPLDRTLLYTALTRAQTQVLLVGDETAARQAVLAAPRGALRNVALDLHFAALMRTGGCII